MNIQDKIIIITGGLGGIAIPIAKVLLKSGAKHVALFDLNEKKERGRSIITEFDQEFGKGRSNYYENDVTDAIDFSKKYDQVAELYEYVDILINNAGICNGKNPALEIDINFKAAVLCTITAIEKMRIDRGGKGGAIINMGSTASLKYHEEIPVYVGTKFALAGFTGSLKYHYDHLGVRVMLMCPGVTETPLLKSATEKPASYVDKITVLLSTKAQSPESVALAIAKLVEKGEAGAVWVVENDEPPCAIKELEFYKNRKIPIN